MVPSTADRHTRGSDPVVVWAVALLGPLAVAGVMVAFRGGAVSANAELIFVLPVMAAAIIGGRVGGVVAAVVAAASFDFFFTRPYYSFTIRSSDDVGTMLVLLIVGLVVAELVVRTRRSEQIARVRQREVTQIRRVSELAAGGEAPGRLITLVQREVVEVLGASGARFERPPFTPALPVLSHGRVVFPGVAGDDATGRVVGSEVALPVWGQGREIGRLVVAFPDGARAAEVSSEQRALASALADQLGAALAAAQ